MNFTYIANLIKTCITYTLWLVIVVPFVIVMCLPLTLLPASIRYDNRLYFALTKIVSWIIMRCSFVRFRVHGIRNLPAYPNQPSIIVINHASALDIPLVEMAVGTYPHLWMIKAAYAKVPLFGTLVRRMYVIVERGAGQHKALRTMYNLAQDANRHILIFPEGKRHTTGHINAFYSGFAMLAQKLNRPVIPMVIHDLHKVFPPTSLVIDSSVSEVKLSIGKPLYIAEGETLQEFTARVQKHFETEMQCSCDLQT